MAAGSARKNPHNASGLSLESDITDLRCGIQHDIPARPSSRLGFNSTRTHDSLLLEDFFGKASPESQASARIFSLSQTWTGSGQLESDITALVAERSVTSQSTSEATHMSLGTHTTLDHQHTSDSFINLSKAGIPDAPSSADFSTFEMAEQDTPLLPVPDSALDSLLFSFPALDTPKFDAHKKYSSLPSPFSPRHPSTTSRSSHRYPPQSHRYRHHGYSRHSFSYLKWFWATRESFWMDSKSPSFGSKAYDGLSVFESSSSPSGLRLLAMSPGSDPTEMQLQPPPPLPLPPLPTLPPLSIHPRSGDLFALRDPYCMHIDRFFVGMPVWTMAKTLWMFDVHMASGGGGGGDKTPAADGSDAFEVEEEHYCQSEGESIETSGSHAFSDDSDSTLVESESEGEVEGCVRGGVADDIGNDDDNQRRGAPPERKDGLGSSDSSFASTFDGYDSDFDLPTPLQKAAIDPVALGKQRPSPSPRWATCWYRRWEILLRLCIENNPAFMGDANVFPTTLSGGKTRPDDDWDESFPDEMEVEGEGECEDPDDVVEFTTAKRVLVVVNAERSDSRGA